jgi:hypothetical protein
MRSWRLFRLHGAFGIRQAVTVISFSGQTHGFSERSAQLVVLVGGADRAKDAVNCFPQRRMKEWQRRWPVADDPHGCEHILPLHGCD